MVQHRAVHTATDKTYSIFEAFENPEPQARFGLLLILVTALHALLLWGVDFRFTPTGSAARIQRSIEVILVRRPPVQHIDPKPDFLAEVKAMGGGQESEQPEPPRQAATPPVLPVPSQVPQPLPPPTRQIARYEPNPRHEPRPIQKPVIKKPEREILKAPSTDTRPSVPTPPVAATPIITEKLLPSTSQLMASTSLEAARISAELDRHSELHSARQRRKHISASTQEYKYATYLEEWRIKVERIGNINYPEEAKKRKLYGNLVLTVSLRPDGSLENVRLIRSSGEKLLDDAAIRIVQLTAPFAPFPPDIRKEADILEITRTWQFLSSNQLFARD